MSISLSDKESFFSLMDEDEKQQYLDEDEKQQYIIENEVIPAYEKYINEKYGDGSYNAYNLIYIDEDNIPELLFDDSGDGTGTEVLCYIDGEVYSTPAWCRGFEFDYVPKENKIFFGGAMYNEFSEEAAHLENGVLVTEHSYSFKLDETADENGPFEIDGVQCSKEEFDIFTEKYFDDNNKENGWQTYSSIQEAYENLKAANS